MWGIRGAGRRMPCLITSTQPACTLSTGHKLACKCMAMKAAYNEKEHMAVTAQCWTQSLWLGHRINKFVNAHTHILTLCVLTLACPHLWGGRCGAAPATRRSRRMTPPASPQPLTWGTCLAAASSSSSATPGLCGKCVCRSLGHGASLWGEASAVRREYATPPSCVLSHFCTFSCRAFRLG